MKRTVRRAWPLPLALALAAASGCGGGGSSTLPTTSGLRTTVTLGTPAPSAAHVAAVNRAVSTWRGAVASNVVFRLRVEFRDLGASGPLVRTTPTTQSVSYTDYFNAFRRNRISEDDKTVVENLQRPPVFALWMNLTADSPNGSGSPTPYVDRDGDRNNATILLTTANAKALALFRGSASAPDGTIVFNTARNWDVDPGNGVAEDAYDLVGYATREIGKVLGFVSGVDRFIAVTQASGPQNEDAVAFVAPLDLVRFRSEDNLDWTSSATAKVFSVDGGLETQANFGLGAGNGDGYPAGSWLPRTNGDAVGLFDGRDRTGRLPGLSRVDRRAMDVIGWEL